ncbi:MAG: T9SS type A sorting domain-containing protein, partial [Bacteroidetes bacterium]|nr:T9SS type A sorting domain-containing protein [Bacteroidota bacterium]
LGAASPPCWVTEVPAAPESAAPFSLYPNPTSGKFRVQYMLEPGQEGWIAVSDLQGREVLRKQLHPMLSGFMLDLSNQPNGIYLYRFIVNGTTRYSGKIELEQ